MSDDFILSSSQYKELLQELKDAEQYGKDADHDLSEVRKENAELKQQLAAFHAAMEREKKPDWEKWLKDLADGIDTYTLNVEHYIATSPAWPKYREMFGHAARQLRYMADSFTLKANFVPSELRIKELEQQLARAQAASCELRKALSLCSALGDDDSAFRTFGLADKGYRLFEVRKLAETAIQSSDCGKGWRSPQDWERLEAEAAVMREALEFCKRGTNLSLIEKSLSTTAGNDLLAKLERWDTLANKVPKPPNAITWEHGVELLNELQDIVWPREALGEQKP